MLTDFAAYPEWNPFIEKASGRVRVGERLRLRIRPPGGGAMAFAPVVLAAEPARELRWRGRVLVPGLFDGEHGFRLGAQGEGTLLVHEERFSGVLVPFVRRMLETSTRAGFEAMNQALRQRVERGAATS